MHEDHKKKKITESSLWVQEGGDDPELSPGVSLCITQVKVRRGKDAPGWGAAWWYTNTVCMCVHLRVQVLRVAVGGEMV